MPKKDIKILYYDCNHAPQEIISSSQFSSIIILHENEYYNYPFERAENIIAFYFYKKHDYETYNKYKDKRYDNIEEEALGLAKLTDKNTIIFLDYDNPDENTLIFTNQDKLDKIKNIIEEYCEPFITK